MHAYDVNPNDKGDGTNYQGCSRCFGAKTVPSVHEAKKKMKMKKKQVGAGRKRGPPGLTHSHSTLCHQRRKNPHSVGD